MKLHLNEATCVGCLGFGDPEFPSLFFNNPALFAGAGATLPGLSGAILPGVAGGPLSPTVAGLLRAAGPAGAKKLTAPGGLLGPPYGVGPGSGPLTAGSVPGYYYRNVPERSANYHQLRKYAENVDVCT